MNNYLLKRRSCVQGAIAQYSGCIARRTAIATFAGLTLAIPSIQAQANPPVAGEIAEKTETIFIDDINEDKKTVHDFIQSKINPQNPSAPVEIAIAEEALWHAIFLKFDTSGKTSRTTISRTMDKKTGEITVTTTVETTGNQMLSPDEFTDGVKEFGDIPAPLTGISESDQKVFAKQLKAELQSNVAENQLVAHLNAAVEKAFDLSAEFKKLAGLSPEATLNGNEEISFDQFRSAASRQLGPLTARTFNLILDDIGSESSLMAGDSIKPKSIESVLNRWRQSVTPPKKALKVKGLVLIGNRDKLRTDPDANALTLRIAGTATDLLSEDLGSRVDGKGGKVFKPAQLGFTKSKGLDSEILIDGALRLDWRRKKWLNDSSSKLLPFAALEVVRRGQGEDLTDLRRYHLQLFSFQNYGNEENVAKGKVLLLEASSIWAGAYYETNLAKDINTVAYGATWEPLLNLGPIHTGRFRQFSKGLHLKYSIDPSFGVEYRDIVHRPIGSNLDDTFYGKLGLKTTLSFFDDKFSLAHDFLTYHSFSADRPDATTRKWTLSIPLTTDGAVSILGTAKSGRVSPGADRTKDYALGLGVQY